MTLFVSMSKTGVCSLSVSELCLVFKKVRNISASDLNSNATKVLST